MGIKLLWTGTTILLSGVLNRQVAYVGDVGSIIMIIGLVLLWLNQ